MWCGKKLSYSVLGQNLTFSHFCDNNKCPCFQIVLPDFMWAEFIKTKQKFDIAMGALYSLDGNVEPIDQSIIDEAHDRIFALDEKEAK